MPSPFTYFNPDVPNGYSCSSCKKTGIKLWRPYSVFYPTLLCSDCLCIRKGIDRNRITKEGRYLSEGGLTDSCGGYIPAIPDEEGVGYWGFTSVPDEGIAWWRHLPN